MRTTLRTLLTTMVLGLFSLTSTGAESSKDNKAATKTGKDIQEARTLDGKKPKACNFKISLS